MDTALLWTGRYSGGIVPDEFSSVTRGYLALSISTAPTKCVTEFNIRKPWIPSTQCIYVFRVTVTRNRTSWATATVSPTQDLRIQLSGAITLVHRVCRISTIWRVPMLVCSTPDFVHCHFRTMDQLLKPSDSEYGDTNSKVFLLIFRPSMAAH
jgi:hypothetical protein